MRNVRGMTPFQLALGVTPQRNIDVDEVPYRIVSPNEQYIENATKAKDAAKAYLDAINDREIREAVQSRTRKPQGLFEVGDLVYFWRVTNVKKSSYWHGPALDATVEPTVSGEPVYWVTYGTAMCRLTGNSLREVAPTEKEEYMKKEMLDRTESKYEVLRRQLESIRGPVRFDDLVDHYDARPPTPEDAPPEGERRYQGGQNSNPQNITQTDESVDDMLRHIFEQQDKVPPTQASVDTRPSSSSKSPSPTRRRTTSPKRTRKRAQPSEEIQRATFESENAARMLDGLPSREKRRKFDEEQIEFDQIDEDGDEVMLLEIGDAEEEEIVYVLKATDSIVEARLSKEERKLLDKAKDEALAPWIQNEAWCRVKRSQAKAEEPGSTPIPIKMETRSHSSRRPQSECESNLAGLQAHRHGHEEAEDGKPYGFAMWQKHHPDVGHTAKVDATCRGCKLRISTSRTHCRNQRLWRPER
jgi:hypothetical protein